MKAASTVLLTLLFMLFCAFGSCFGTLKLDTAFKNKQGTCDAIYAPKLQRCLWSRFNSVQSDLAHVGNTATTAAEEKERNKNVRQRV